jgi:hypothetical protein
VPLSQSQSEVPWSGELRARLGALGQATPLASSPRSLVWQVDLAGTPAAVKQVVDGPGADGRYERELAALRLAARADPPVAPALLGADPGRRVLVLEWLSGGRPADDWVVGYAEALARLHAVTTADDAGALPRWAGPGGRDVAAFLGLAAALGARVPPRVPGELDDLVSRLRQDQGNALLHGDPCPGNDLHTGGGVRFVDFERAALGSGLVELAYLRIGFPTCWCSTAPPAPLLARAEAAYLATWRAATGTEAAGDLADACAGWLLQGDALVQQAHRGKTDYLALAVQRDWRWGTATARQRLAYRLGVVAQLTAGRAELAGLSQLSADLRVRMLARWPGLAPLQVSREIQRSQG